MKVRFSALAAGLVVALGYSLLGGSGPLGATAASAGSPAPCGPASDGPAPPATATTLTTLRQAYECIFARYYAGSILDDRTLLTAAFAAFTQELQSRGLDRAAATLPRLSGHRDRDWNAFATVYARVLATLPDDAGLRQALAAATMQGMITALNDNHNAWIVQQTPPSVRLGLGIAVTTEGRATPNIRDASGPIYLRAVQPGSAADKAGLRPGDIIEAVNGVPLFVAGMLSPGVLGLLQPQSADETIRITIRRPATDTTMTVALHEEVLPIAQPPAVSARVLPGGIVYAVLPTFSPGVAAKVLGKIAELRQDDRIRGVVLDLRGNGGGRDEEVAKLLSALVHGKIYSWDCDVRDHCTPHRTDDSTPLLKMPVTLLTDGWCASACDAFSGAVRDLQLGKLVGARTAGMVSGMPSAYALDDNSVLLLTPLHHRSANGEIINGIGVAVDYPAPMTAADLSAGRDPALDKALALMTI
ncbi:carboxyl-terminal processing protease [Hamadaea flava]|uniref:S41 family peptidase n=1 Tax=Hamadaea flava TaxID=1742688 RepID=A0ABV8LNF2_9ACTN|nr:S41 family peptidase [Hamadaea flava]MCP2329593.1 carboxyl-terminal processing protease [Hamadaea flava]